MLLKSEVDEDPSEVLIILFEAMIELFDMSLVQETQYFFLELPTTFARNDLNEFYFPVNRFLHDAIQLRVNLSAAVVDIVQVQLKLCHYPSVSWAGSKNQTEGAGSV